VAEAFPDVPLAAHVALNETLLSIEKARQILGYEPQHSWRERHDGRRAEPA
jgi:UDP-glucose 4-epimerase